VSEQEHPDEEELARALTEELANLRVESVLIGALIQVSSIGYRRLGLTEDTAADRDLEQTKLAIDTMKALTPVLDQVVAPELLRDFHSSVANLQLAYAKAISDVPGGQTPGHGQGGQEASGDAPARSSGEGSEEAQTDVTGGQTPGAESDEGADGDPL
jgi:hypothetical protein